MVEVVGSSPTPATKLHKKDMKVLTLSIKQKFFDEIVAGTKKNEYREIRPKSAKKYIEYVDDKGVVYKADAAIPDEVEIEAVPIKYDALKLLTGEYSGKRPYIIIEVKGAEVEVAEDEDGNEIVYEYNGEPYVVARMNYQLGDILERSDY